MGDPRLKSFVDRIENVETEEGETRKGKREIYDEAHEAGYNKKALRKLIAERRQKDREEINDAMDGYRVALGMAAKAVDDGMSLDDASVEYGFSRSAIHRASHCNENASSGTTVEIGPKPTPASVLPCAEVWKEITLSAEAQPAPPSQHRDDMTEADLGDPLLLIDKSRAQFREKVRTAAASVKVTRVVETPPRVDPEDTLEIPPFLKRDKERVPA